MRLERIWRFMSSRDPVVSGNSRGPDAPSNATELQGGAVGHPSRGIAWPRSQRSEPEVSSSPADAVKAESVTVRRKVHLRPPEVGEREWIGYCHSARVSAGRSAFGPPGSPAGIVAGIFRSSLRRSAEHGHHTAGRRNERRGMSPLQGSGVTLSGERGCEAEIGWAGELTFGGHPKGNPCMMATRACYLTASKRHAPS
jgi:hypothetical protein